LKTLRNRLFALAIVIGLPVLKLIFGVFPKQANGFAFAVRKPRLPADMHPWLTYANGEVGVNAAWLSARYRQVGDEAGPR
jgi:hypothetical protein